MDDIRIVILQRGWVVVGAFERDGERCRLRGGSVVRDWGTTNGLGEIALNGPTSRTRLDRIPEMEFHELTVIGTLKCEVEKWRAHVT